MLGGFGSPCWKPLDAGLDAWTTSAAWASPTTSSSTATASELLADLGLDAGGHRPHLPATGRRTKPDCSLPHWTMPDSSD